MPTMRLRPGLCPGPHWGSLQRSSAPDPLAGKGGGAPWDGLPEGGPPEGEGEEEKGKAREGENCCHQMSDFTAKMRGRAI